MRLAAEAQRDLIDALDSDTDAPGLRNASAAIDAILERLDLLAIFGGEGSSRGKQTPGGLDLLHEGGIVQGPTGATVPILAQAGERVVPRNRAAGGSGGSLTVNVNGLVTDPQGTAEAIVEGIRLYEQTNGPIF